MRFTPGIFASLLKPIDRRAFKASVEAHRGDFYGKPFHSWEHLVALLFARFSGAASLRALETGFNAQSNHHYRQNRQAATHQPAQAKMPNQPEPTLPGPRMTFPGHSCAFAGKTKSGRGIRIEGSRH